MNVTLRSWQARFVRQLAGHRRDDFLLVACPAAGKTIAAGVGAATVMESRGCDQLIVVCPTVIVRDQWQAELARLGFRMLTHLDRRGWPAHVHGVCVTYAQVTHRPEQFAEACAARQTVVIFDEIHHAGEQRTWGGAAGQAFAGACFRLSLSGTPFRSDQDRIPWVRYDSGRCLPDFAYDYPRAVRDGVCRPIEFRAHDGVITWVDEGAPRTSAFSEKVDQQTAARRLRAALDPGQPYLLSLMQAAHTDLAALREKVPDAAGLVICDTQAHALEVDRLLGDIASELPTIAISDLPHAHQAIHAFATDSTEWIVSVRMVAEGVDIPRLGVIVWATAASTELMVRQVAGRALRGREEYAELPAIVHLPADPRLVEYAERLDVLGGVSLRSRAREARDQPQRDPAIAVDETARRIDPRPFLKWFDRQADTVGTRALLARCGWDHDAGMATIYRWRKGGRAPALTIFDVCHLAGADFDTLYAGPRYTAQRAFVQNPDLTRGRQHSCRAIEAVPHDDPPRAIEPPLPDAPGHLFGAPEPAEISTPELPPSPQDLEAAAAAVKHDRAEVLRLLNVYVQLRRRVDPAYQLASAHAELVQDVGPVTADAPAELLAEARAWVSDRTATLAAAHPEHVVEIARAQRRATLAAAAG